MMDKFLSTKDSLSHLIQEKATELFIKLRDLKVDELGMPDHCLHYFKGSHFKRLFFSIETSAHLLYRSISLTKIPVQEIVIMDYGAGVGTLYTLAKMIGCKTVIYNDHLKDWQQSAQLIAEAIGVSVDLYIVGDIDNTLLELNEKKIQCHIITSRNVVEHIYKLDYFYSSISIHQPQALIYSSTTANYKNPVARYIHIRLHKKVEKNYRNQRKEIIEKLIPGLKEEKVYKLAVLTRGLAGVDLEQRILNYKKSNQYPLALDCGSNTCDPFLGVWAEHLLRFEEYKQLIDGMKFTVEFEPGFWDTHYSSNFKNKFCFLLNKMIKLNSSLGFVVAPFIYITATPITLQDNQK